MITASGIQPGNLEVDCALHERSDSLLQITATTSPGKLFCDSSERLHSLFWIKLADDTQQVERIVQVVVVVIRVPAVNRNSVLWLEEVAVRVVIQDYSALYRPRQSEQIFDVNHVSTRAARHVRTMFSTQLVRDEARWIQLGHHRCTVRCHRRSEDHQLVMLCRRAEEFVASRPLATSHMESIAGEAEADVKEIRSSWFRARLALRVNQSFVQVQH